MSKWVGTCSAGLAVALLAAVPATAAGEAGPLLAKIKAVGREGAGNVEAAEAWRGLVRLGPDVLVEVLAAQDGADPTAANWLRAAADAIAERETQAGRPLPVKALEAFVLDTGHNPRARRQAYEWLTREDQAAPARLLPRMLDDPSTELRRDAIALALGSALQLPKAEQPAAYRKLFAAARDKDQVEALAKRLKELGVETDLAAHFGFIREWMLITPFDSTGGAGYARAYEPEQKIDLAAVYPGKQGAEARWKAHRTADAYGLVDLNKALAKHKGAVAYAYAAFDSPEDRPVDIRLGCATAVKVFLNGKLVCSHEEYHHGVRMDQYVGRGKLRAGRNELLVKVCQNEQTEEWAQSWQFQLRVCDATGGAVPLTLTTAKKAGGEGREVRP